jgi:hypothetical protein
MDGSRLPQYISQWTLPSLQNVIFTDFRLDYYMGFLFTFQGANIVSLDLGGKYKDYGEMFAEIHPHLTALQHLSISGHLNPDPIPFLISYWYTPIVHVNFDLTRASLSEERVYRNETLIESLSNFRTTIDILHDPAITFVRLVGYQNSSFLKERWNPKKRIAQGRIWIEEWAKCGVRLEDSHSNLLKIPEDDYLI